MFNLIAENNFVAQKRKILYGKNVNTSFFVNQSNLENFWSHQNILEKDIWTC